MRTGSLWPHPPPGTTFCLCLNRSSALSLHARRFNIVVQSPRRWTKQKEMFVCITYINNGRKYAKRKEKSATAGLFETLHRRKAACNKTPIEHFTRSERESAQEVVTYVLDVILLEPMQQSQFLAMESSVKLPLSRSAINDISVAPSLPSLRSFNEGTKGRALRSG